MNRKRSGKSIRQQVKELFEGGHRNIEEFEARISANRGTLYKYLKEFSDQEEKLNNITEQIDRMAEEALVKGLEEYKNNPGNKDLQSLVLLLKQFKERNKPSKELNNYIITFMDLVVEFYEIKGLEEKRKAFQEDIYSLSEFLRIKCNSF